MEMDKKKKEKWEEELEKTGMEIEKEKIEEEI